MISFLRSSDTSLICQSGFKKFKQEIVCFEQEPFSFFRVSCIEWYYTGMSFMRPWEGIYLSFNISLIFYDFQYLYRDFIYADNQ